MSAQQVLASTSVSRFARPVDASAASSRPADLAGYEPAATVPTSAVPTSLVVSAALPGMPSYPTLYEAIQPAGVPSVCSEALPPMLAYSDYAFGRLQFNSAAIKGTFRHENLVKMARNFVPGQPLPDAPSYVALTNREKFELYLKHTHNADLAVGAVIDSLISQASGAYPRFGGGMPGYGKRLGASVAGAESATLFSGYVFPALFHQDPRFFRSRQSSISNRLAYAASRVIIGRSDSGHNVINFSQILSQFVQAGVSNAYIPYRNETVSGTMENALASLGSVAQADILNEFWPDIKEFLSRHNPENLVHHKDSPITFSDQLATR